MIRSWDEVRKQYPNKWLVLEAVSAHSIDKRRVLDSVDVVEVFKESESALRSYLKLHRQNRGREMYVVHTSRQQLDIGELKWAGIRTR